MDSNNPRYIYDKHGMHGARVGQAVTDILSKEQPECTVEEMLEGFSKKFVEELEKSVQDGLEKYKDTFYVLVLTKKEPWSDIVVRNWFIPRQTPPHALDLIYDYPNHTKTLYMISDGALRVTVVWSIPAMQDCVSIARNPSIHDPQLVKWVKDAHEGSLNLDTYDHMLKH